MRRFLIVLLAASLSLSSLSAKAGQSSSSKGPSVSVGTKAKSTPVTTQYSSTAIKPTTTTSTVSRPTQSSSTPTTPSTAVSSTTTNNTSTHTIERSSDSGIGIGGVIVGTAVGTMVGNSLSGHNQQAPVIINNGQPTQPQTTQPAAYQSDVQRQPQTTTSVTNQQSSSSMSVFSMILLLLLVALLSYGSYRLFIYYRRTHTMNTMAYEDNLPKFSAMYIDVQNYVSINTIQSKSNLRQLCTPEMYLHFTTIASENAEQGLHNIVSNVQVLDCTTREVTEDDSLIYHSVKIRAKFLDYVTNDSGAVVQGSDTDPITDIEVWTFVSNKNNTSWRLSAIEQYVK